MNFKVPENLTPKIFNELRENALKNPEAFWEEQASQLLWHKKWDTVCDSSFSQEDVHIKWFEGGKLNVCENCVDRHLKDKAKKPAIIWEPDDPNKEGRVLTFEQLHKEVMICSNMLKELGVQHGDRVTLYMPMVPEAAIAMLACARIGAIHSVVFGGFSSASLKKRIIDCDSRIVITANTGKRGGKTIQFKKNVDEAIIGTNVRNILVLQHTNEEVEFDNKRDIWWHELKNKVDSECPVEAFDSENQLFILYTSGSTGEPKGLLHTSGGYLLYAMHTFKNVFNYKSGDIYWCTADVGWITGHSYIVYGPLAAGSTTLMFEGTPTYPTASRFWEVVDKHKVSLFYTAPTSIRMLMKEGSEFVEKTKRSSLRVLGSVGEPINPSAWNWYNDVVGNKKCNIVDTWWQTETGGHLITPIPNACKTPPGVATLPYFGIDAGIFDADGKEIDGPGTGALCIKHSWPGQARNIWGNHERFIETYFSAYPGKYFSGDSAAKDGNGFFKIEGRMDDVVNVSGHRLGTAEIEAAINTHPKVAESAVVGVPNELKGQGIYAFIQLKSAEKETDTFSKDINNLLREKIGPIASLDKMQVAASLPKTRSGKIMRRILRKIAEGEIKGKNDYEKLGDISTLLNPEDVEQLIKNRQ